MLCTNCSSVVAPVVALDLDGTLGDYHGHLIQFASMWLGRTHDQADPYTGSERFGNWFARSFATDLTTFRAVKLAFRQGGMKRSMPVKPGAYALVQALRVAGAEVWFTTTRPWERFDRVDPDTKEWLARNRLVGDALLFNEDKLGELIVQVQRERVIAVLDDEWEQLDRARALELGEPIQLVTQYNRESGWDGVKSPDLGDACARIEQLITRWEGATRWLDKVEQR
jgi:hypothetical protein